MAVWPRLWGRLVAFRAADSLLEPMFFEDLPGLR